jgi:hypothetical protein
MQLRQYVLYIDNRLLSDDTNKIYKGLCWLLSYVRQTFSNFNNLPVLLTNITGDTILKFFKEINLYANI